VSLDVGDRLSHEFRSLGANLLVTPQADTLPLEIGGVDYRPVNAGAYLSQSDLPKIKSVFWHNNIIAFAPVFELTVEAASSDDPAAFDAIEPLPTFPVIGTWAAHSVQLQDGIPFETGIEKTNPWWRISKGRWFNETAQECVVGKNLGRHTGGLVDGKFVRRMELGNYFLLIRPNQQPLALKAVGFLDTGGPEDDAIIVPLKIAQQLANKPGQYRQLYVSALTKPEDDFARRSPATMTPDELERWSCSPYISSIAYSIKQVLPGSDVRVIRRVAEGEGRILIRVRTLLWLVTLTALLAAALAVGASSAASVIERRTEIGLMKALGAGPGMVGFLLAAEQLLLAVIGGAIGYALGIFLARLVGEKIFGVAPQPSLLVMVVIVALAATVTLAGSALPLRRAARYEPAPILRGE
jgi:putative ABC transport system permease protein